MKVQDVRDLVRAQSADHLETLNDHHINLKQALVEPSRISVIARSIQKGITKDQVLDVWLVAKEQSNEGYRIILREDGSAFGLASSGFPKDKHMVLVGWYGDLVSTFKSM